MGANAQTTVPTFTAGEVLTAAQQNQSARTGVPVFATTITRDAGFGGTGEKTLAEGQLCYVEGTGLQSYNGSSWVTWGTAPSSGALVRIAGETAFTSASQVDVDNCFTSTYTNYVVQLTITGGTATGSVWMRLRVGGTTATTNYKSVWIKSEATSVGAATGTTGFQFSEAASSTSSSSIMYVYAPQLAAITRATSHGALAFTTPNTEGYIGSHQHNAATAYDGLSILPTSGNITGYYTIYGLAKA